MMKTKFYSKKNYSSKSMALLVLVGILLGFYCIPLNIASATSAPPEVWNRRYSVESHSPEGRDVAVAGNDVYVVGEISNSDNAAFIQKYDSNGNLIWTRLWNVSGENDGFNAVDIDNNKIYAAGWSKNGSQQNTLLVCYDMNGNQQWNRTTNSDPAYSLSSDKLEDIVINDANSIYVVGASSNSSSVNTAIIMKYNSTGHLIWSHRWGTAAASDWGHGVALDGSNAIYMCGATDSYGPGTRAAFLAKYDSSGNFGWNVTWGGSSSEWGWSVVTDVSHNIYVTGRSTSVAAPSTAFLTKFNSNGQILWNYTLDENDQVGSAGDGMALAIDANGFLYIVAGLVHGGLKKWTEDIYVAQYDSSGNKQWSMIWGNLTASGDDVGYGVAVSGTGLYVVGYSSDGTGNNDAVLIKFYMGSDTGWVILLIIIFPLVGVGLAGYVLYKRREEL